MCQWLLALVVAVVGGGIVTELFYRGVIAAIDLPRKPSRPRIAPWFTGIVERLLFVPVVAFSFATDSGGVLAAMGGWLALKLASNWHREPVEGEKPDQNRNTRALLALLTGAISMACALIGGLMLVEGQPLEAWAQSLIGP